MTNKPKAIGTAGETAVVRWIRGLGWSDSQCTRKTLSGRADVGDIWVECWEGRLVIEVKAGTAAKTLSHGQAELWMAEAVEEAKNAARDGTQTIPILVAQRAGKGPANAGEWWAYIWHSDYMGLMRSPVAADYLVRVRLMDIMRHLNAAT